MFTNILFPVDFSDRCKTVAPFVRAAAQRDGSNLTLASFVDASVMWYGTADVPCIPELNFPGMVEETKQSLAAFARDYFPGLETKIVADLGDPGSCIVEMAHDSNIDLIMMPTRGHGLFRRALLGSVTAKVLHDAECAVWTSAHAEAPEYPASLTETSRADQNMAWRNVICAVDTTPDALRLIRCAKEIGQNFHATVYLAHAVPLLTERRPEKYYNREFETALKESARETINAMQKEAGTEFRNLYGSRKHLVSRGVGCAGAPG